jgi:hypothetical protein
LPLPLPLSLQLPLLPVAAVSYQKIIMSEDEQMQVSDIEKKLGDMSWLIPNKGKEPGVSPFLVSSLFAFSLFFIGPFRTVRT